MTCRQRMTMRPIVSAIDKSGPPRALKSRRSILGGSEVVSSMRYSRNPAADAANNLIGIGFRLARQVFGFNGFLALSADQYRLVTNMTSRQIGGIHHGHIHGYPSDNRHTMTADQSFPPVR